MRRLDYILLILGFVIVGCAAGFDVLSAGRVQQPSWRTAPAHSPVSRVPSLAGPKQEASALRSKKL
jgi:hypothetical protein